MQWTNARPGDEIAISTEERHAPDPPLALAVMCIATDSDAQTAYHKPPKAVADILDAR